MKKLISIFIFSMGVAAYAQQTTEVKTEAGEVTVFISGAQVVREKAVDIPAGESMLKFTGLSPYITPGSIRVKADNGITVLSVNQQQNFFAKPEKPALIKDLESKLKEVSEALKLEQTYLQITTEEIAFLNANRDISSNMQEISLATLQQTSAFYGTRLRELKLREADNRKKIEELTIQQQDIQNQINALSGKDNTVTGEIIVKVKAANPAKADFEISYIVKNVSWYPSYDIRAKSISDPVQIVYKANIKQDTKEDWKNVKLKLSSSDPDISGIAPELQTYYLDYNLLPPVYNRFQGNVSGHVSDASTGESLPGAVVRVAGTTIGAVADANGNYSILVPENAGNLEFSFVGFETQTRAVTGSVVNVALAEDLTMLQEVVVTGYASSSRPKISIRGVASSEDMVAEAAPQDIVNVSQNQTAVNFEIDEPYTILSDNQSYTVEMKTIELPADYNYYCVPKVNTNAFLLARVKDWEKYSLLEGEASIFFENTFVGKSILDLRNAPDTLELSLGTDKNIIVSREKTTDFTSSRFIGTRKEEKRGWTINVKNNKNMPVKMVVLDQVPVSAREEIEVEVQKTSNADYNADDGEIKWEFTLEPGNNKTLQLEYAVSFPKGSNIIVE